MGNQFSNGIGGALSLALIAFSTVFLVLGGLTLIIYCVKYLAAIGGAGKHKASPPSGGKAPAPRPTSPAAKAPQAAVASGAEGSRLAAVISAAILASAGREVRIKKITPLGGTPAGVRVGWKASALLENRQGMVRDPWSRRS